MQKALTAGLFMNAVQLSETTADLQDPSSSGINVYRLLRSSGPGSQLSFGIHMLLACWLLQVPQQLQCC